MWLPEAAPAERQGPGMQASSCLACALRLLLGRWEMREAGADGPRPDPARGLFGWAGFRQPPGRGGGDQQQQGACGEGSLATAGPRVPPPPPSLAGPAALQPAGVAGAPELVRAAAATPPGHPRQHTALARPRCSSAAVAGRGGTRGRSGGAPAPLRAAAATAAPASGRGTPPRQRPPRAQGTAAVEAGRGGLFRVGKAGGPPTPQLTRRICCSSSSLACDGLSLPSAPPLPLSRFLRSPNHTFHHFRSLGTFLLRVRF